MSNEENLQPKLRQKANDILGRLSPAEREALLVKNWMSHDARWFMAVAAECGIQVANRLNQIVTHRIGKVEAQRVARALQLPPMTTVDDYLPVQEVFMSLLGRDLADYDLVRVGDNAFKIHLRRCFAHENVVRAGTADHYVCGIFSRTNGWLKAMGLEYEMAPPLGKCLKVEGRECVHTFTFKAESPPPGVPIEDHQ